MLYFNHRLVNELIAYLKCHSLMKKIKKLEKRKNKWIYLFIYSLGILLIDATTDVKQTYSLSNRK